MSPNRIIDGRGKKIQRTGLHKPVLGILLTIIVALGSYYFKDHPLQDKISTGIIAFSFTVAAIIVLVFTADWTWRAVGVMIGLGGAALTYIFLFFAFIGIVEINQLYTRATIRSSLDVGGILLFLGICGWALERRKGKAPGGFEWIDPRQNYRE